MNRIEVLQTFKHAGQTFYAGEVRVVSAEDAAYFCTQGWASAGGLVTGNQDTSHKTLKVHNVNIGQKAAKLGVK